MVIALIVVALLTALAVILPPIWHSGTLDHEDEEREWEKAEKR